MEGLGATDSRAENPGRPRQIEHIQAMWEVELAWSAACSITCSRPPSVAVHRHKQLSFE
jgi:hypothetical protein